jgi:hypothetical protein
MVYYKENEIIKLIIFLFFNLSVKFSITFSAEKISFPISGWVSEIRIIEKIYHTYRILWGRGQDIPSNYRKFNL